MERKFTYDWFLNHGSIWIKYIDKLIGKENLNFLEIGSFEGRSALWLLDNILTHQSSKITCLDLFPKVLLGKDNSKQKQIFLDNTKEYTDKIILIDGVSQVNLRKLKVGFYDFVYIDGSHLAPDVLEDAVLSFRLIKKGGIIIFDDYLWGEGKATIDKPKIAVDSFLSVYSNRCKVLYKGYQVIIEKTGD